MFNYSLQVPSTYLNTSFAKIKGIGRQERRKSDGRRRLYLRVLPSREHAIKKGKNQHILDAVCTILLSCAFPKVVGLHYVLVFYNRNLRNIESFLLQLHFQFTNQPAVAHQQENQSSQPLPTYILLLVLILLRRQSRTLLL